MTPSSPPLRSDAYFLTQPGAAATTVIFQLVTPYEHHPELCDIRTTTITFTQKNTGCTQSGSALCGKKTGSAWDSLERFDRTYSNHRVLTEADTKELSSTLGTVFCNAVRYETTPEYRAALRSKAFTLPRNSKPANPLRLSLRRGPPSP